MRTAAFARRTVMMALVLFAAGVPLLPLNEMKVTATLLAGCVLLPGALLSLRSGTRAGRTGLDAPAVTFLALAVAATVFAVNPRVSLVPTAVRGEGLLDYLIYVPMALAAARLRYLEIREFLTVLLGAAALIGTLGVGQYYGVDATRWIGSRGLDYGFHSWSTLANPDFLGGYAALVLPIGVAMAATAPARRSWLGYAGVSTLLFAALLGSQTRSAWAACAPAAILLLWFLPRSVEASRRLGALALAFAAVTVLMILTQPQVSFMGRAESAFNPADSSMQGRLWIWAHTIPMIAERPILGWGFSAVQGHLPGVGTPDYYRLFGHGPVVIDVAHNDLLQVSVNMGLAGLAAYLWIWAAAVRAAAGAVRAAASPVRPEAAGILAGFAAYVVWLQFLWSHIGVTNVFWVLAGLAVAAYRAAQAADPDTVTAATGIDRPAEHGGTEG